MTEEPLVLYCRGLRRCFGQRVAVDDLSFDIRRGETYGLLGPNGSGKTTAISMVAGILRADAGEVRMNGAVLTRRSGHLKGRIGLVPQEIALFEDLTAVENLRFFGRLQGLRGRQLQRRIDAVLDVVGLAERGGDRIEDYSGGMKRRANIAVGLLHQPDLLILDEPTVGVDPQSRNQTLRSIEELGGQGLSVLYTTHYMEEAEQLCDRIGILDAGRLIAEGTRHELVAGINEHEVITVSAPPTSDNGQALADFAGRCGEIGGVVEATVAPDRVEIRVDGAEAVLGHLGAVRRGVGGSAGRGGVAGGHRLGVGRGGDLRVQPGPHRASSGLGDRRQRLRAGLVGRELRGTEPAAGAADLVPGHPQRLGLAGLR